MIEKLEIKITVESQWKKSDVRNIVVTLMSELGNDLPVELILICKIFAQVDAVE